MPTHLYCLLPPGSSAAPPDSPPIRVITVDGIVAWVGDADAPRLSRDVRQATRATIEHDRVISAALAHGVSPVPAALADPYASDADAAADVTAHRSEILKALAAIRDRVEMTVVIGLTDAPPAEQSAGRGRAYLEQLRTLPSRAAAIADRVSAVLEPIAGEGRRRGEGGRAAVSHLVSRDAISRYRQAALTASGEGYRLVIDGPRAPYSFASFSPGNGIVTHSPAPAA
jgi:hypothetical protein